MNQKKLQNHEIERIPLSLVDDLGIVFRWSDRILRTVNKGEEEKFRVLLDSGLFSRLSEKRLVPSTSVTDIEVEMEGCNLVLEHEEVWPITYPFEWSFSMFKEAGLKVVKLEEELEKEGCELIDHHAYNILFDGFEPQFVDVGAIRKKAPDGRSFNCHQVFRGYYLSILKIWKRNSFIARRLLVGDGSPVPDEAYFDYQSKLFRLLPKAQKSRVGKALGLARGVSSIDQSKLKRLFGKVGAGVQKCLKAFDQAIGLPWQIDTFPGMRKAMNKVVPDGSRSQWGNYQASGYSEKNTKIEVSARFDRIAELINESGARRMLEVAGNQGFFSRHVLEETCVEHVVCADYDENAIENLYVNGQARFGEIGNNKKITPVVYDFVRPLGATWTESSYKRFSCELVVAMALLHHLILSQGLPLAEILTRLSRFSTRLVMVEFMPKGLWATGSASVAVPDWYTLEWFRAEFVEHFHCELEEQLEPNRILFIGRVRE